MLYAVNTIDQNIFESVMFTTIDLNIQFDSFLVGCYTVCQFAIFNAKRQNTKKSKSRPVFKIPNFQCRKKTFQVLFKINSLGNFNNKILLITQYVFGYLDYKTINFFLHYNLQKVSNLFEIIFCIDYLQNIESHCYFYLLLVTLYTLKNVL